MDKAADFHDAPKRDDPRMVTVMGIEFEVMSLRRMPDFDPILELTVSQLCAGLKRMRMSPSMVYRADALSEEAIEKLMNMPPGPVVAVDIKQDTQQAVMQFDPYNCLRHPWPSHAGQYRDTWVDRKWYFNPWTGNKRLDSDIESDPKGFLIVDPQSIKP